MDSDSAASTFITGPDGLKLHVRSHGRRTDAGLPLVCLPGLARTVADFEAVASALATDSDTRRWVVALDSRGRGRSDYDRNANYTLPAELADLMAVLTALSITRAVFLGTSRGGILTMLLAAARPTAIAGCVLNDIGPVIEAKGLMRIKSYVGRLPNVASMHEAADVLRRLFASQFPKLTGDDWVAFARRTFKEAGGRILPDYDVKLRTIFNDIDIDRPLPPLWDAFDALAGVPVMIIRGGLSDILSAATVGLMRRRRKRLDVLEVPDQGHAPLLMEAEVIGRIASFAARCEGEAARSRTD
jgi:pimeloyl-ACP methyl ester carboxylesterase